MGEKGRALELGKALGKREFDLTPNEQEFSRQRRWGSGILGSGKHPCKGLDLRRAKCLGGQGAVPDGRASGLGHRHGEGGQEHREGPEGPCGRPGRVTA